MASLAPCNPLKSTLGSVWKDDGEHGTQRCPRALQRFGVEHPPPPAEDLGISVSPTALGPTGTNVGLGGLQGTLVRTMFAGGPGSAAPRWPAWHRGHGGSSEVCGCCHEIVWYVTSLLGLSPAPRGVDLSSLV